MSSAGKKILWALVVFVVLALVVVVWAGWMFFKRPLTVDAHFSRLALKKAGLAKTTVQAPAGTMTLWEGGEGPTMVLLHGAGDQAGAWARIVPRLMDNHRLLIPDLPGHWNSAPRSGPIHVPQILGGLEALMDARCADSTAILVGNSMGAWMAMLYARDNPDRVDRIVAINGGALTNPDTTVNIFPSTRDEAYKTMQALLGPNTPIPPGFVLDHVVRHAREGPAARFAETAAEMGDWVLDGRLHEVTVPVELVWGAADGLMTMSYARRLRDGLPRARLSPVEDCGHIPQRECPYRLLGVMLEALEQPPPEAKSTPVTEDLKP
jgi:pimeloyl-ACP methyl ester carboxylesterase